MQKVNVIDALPDRVLKHRNGGRLRVAAYCRVSTDSEEQENSYEAQVDYYTAKINLNPEWKLAGIFADEGISGVKDKNRPEFMRMIELCKQKKIDLIYVKSISWFARNTVHSIEYVRLLKNLGVTVIFEKEGFNSSQMSDEFLLTVFGALAQAESESLSENVKIGNRMAYKQGNIPYRRLYGYVQGIAESGEKNGKAEIYPEQAEVVKQIFGLFLEGKSLREIKDWLEENHIVSPAGKPVWTISTLQSMLENERYMGDTLLQKTYVENCLTKKLKKNNGELPQYYIENSHPGIISKEMFKLVQIELSRRNSKQKTSQKASKTEQGRYSAKYALTEKVICNDCGSIYRRTTWARNGKKKIVWRCLSRLEFGTRYCSKSPTIPEPELQQAILRAVQDLMGDKQEMVSTLKGQLEQGHYEKAGVMTPAKVNRKIEELNTEMQSILKMMTGADDTKFYERKFKAISKQIAGYREELSRLKQKQNVLIIEDYQLSKTLVSIDENSVDIKEYSDEFVRELIEKIFILSRDKIKIRFTEGYQVEVSLKE